ncbi:MAG: hypothetical protein ACFFDH_25480, partial [Promethearchaeota archaeon]
MPQIIKFLYTSTMFKLLILIFIILNFKKEIFVLIAQRSAVELASLAKDLKNIKARSKYADSIYFGIQKLIMQVASKNF